MAHGSEVVHVVAAVIVSDDRILACKRAPHKVSAGLWEFPGGKVELGERPEPALLRELLEELSLEIEILRRFDTSETQVGEVVIRLETFICVPKHEFRGQSSDHDEFLWLTQEDLNTVLWASPDLPAVKKLLLSGF